jgi:CitMHS family citrate-Mg2+:H+ or citrate-Ca2+:H+ symporter
MLVAAGIVILVLLLILILKSNFLPGNIMALVPLVIAPLVGLGFENTLKMAHLGIVDVSAVVVVFIFAALYFGVMSDAGMFEPLINRLMRIKWVGKSVFSVVCVAGFISMVADLDGQSLTTLLIMVPPMLIVFDKLHISRTLLGLIFVTVSGSMNILPWAGPVVRVAAVIDMDVMEIFKKLLPAMALALVLSYIVLYIESRKEQKLGFFTPTDNMSFGSIAISEEALALRRPKLFWFNIFLTVILMVLLFTGLPAHLVFIAGCAIALPMNYRSLKEQDNRVKAHAGPVILNAYTIIGAGILLGVMDGGGIFTAMGTAFANLVPDVFDKYIHLIFGILITPLSYLLNTDAMIYGIMPVVIETGEKVGISATKIASMFVVGRVMGTGLCLTTPSVYLGLGLLNITYKDAFKRAFKWTLLLGTILVFFVAFTVS